MPPTRRRAKNSAMAEHQHFASGAARHLHPCGDQRRSCHSGGSAPGRYGAARYGSECSRCGTRRHPQRGDAALRSGFIRVISRTPSSAGLAPTAELDADGVIRIGGLRVLPNDNVVVSYTIQVASSGPNAPAPETVIHQFRASITSDSLGLMEGQLSLNDDLELKIKGVAVFAAPQFLTGGVIPVVTHDLPGSKAALDAIFRRTRMRGRCSPARIPRGWSMVSTATTCSTKIPATAPQRPSR